MPVHRQGENDLLEIGMVIRQVERDDGPEETGAEPKAPKRLSRESSSSESSNP